MKYFILLVYITLFLATPTWASVTPSISLSPTKFDIQVEPGQLQQVTIKLTNNSDVAIPFKAEVMDFAPKDDKGAIEFGMSLPNHSAKSWLRVEKPDILLEAGESKSITVTLSPPEIITPGSYFAVVMFQSALPSNYFDSDAQAKIIPWIGELFLLRVGDPPSLNDSSLTIRRFDYPRFHSRPKIPLTLEVANNTPYHLAPESEFELKSLFGTVVARINKDETTVMPGRSRIIEAEIEQKNPLGIYRGSAAIQIAGYRKAITSQPFYLLTLLGGILLLFGTVGIGKGLHYAILHRSRLKNRFLLAWSELTRRRK